MATPSELAREAGRKADGLRIEFDLFRGRVERLEPDRLREQVKVLEDQVAELKKWKDAAEKRQWQFVYIVLGAVASLLASVVVQLILALVKKSP